MSPSRKEANLSDEKRNPMVSYTTLKNESKRKIKATQIMPNNNISENEVKIISSATISFLTIATFPFL